MVTTSTARQTKAIASDLAKKIVVLPSSHARVIALKGNLGAGKTTFVQGFAKALGVSDTVQSPTFVLMKIYAVKKKHIRHLVHIDAYRIESLAEMKHIGLSHLLQDKDAIILIEWADRIKKIIPKNAVWVTLEHGKTMTERSIAIKNIDER
ncbi:MAG: tRNA (adenosine(37)-N6)-threonylcarbamoyltransferase complex ATPase subunit type 1 TsaE [bacterium]|nr:tRNA (adenosine(37)-N6)-threonylcarbamoyltransferase complex ATPase subunit type 1 TsaE [bacterium]